MVELRPNNYLETLNKYENGCNRKECKNCCAYLNNREMCVFDRLKQWQNWADKKRSEYVYE